MTNSEFPRKTACSPFSCHVIRTPASQVRLHLQGLTMILGELCLGSASSLHGDRPEGKHRLVG